MSELAERIDLTAYVRKEHPRRPDWAPYRAAMHEDESTRGGRFSGFGVLAALILFSGITVAAARSNAGIARSFEISQESVLGIAWLIQGAAALLCFILAVRWLRS